MIVFSILIAWCVSWFTVFIILNFYYDTLSKDKPKSLAIKVTLISFFIMLCLLSLAYCNQ